MRVWVTRTQPGAATTAQQLRDLGHDALVAPVLEVRTLAVQPDLRNAGVVAYTSINGVRAAPDTVRELPAYVVGDATAAAAREAGHPFVFSADGDVRALVELIASRHALIRGDVLYLGARDPSADLIGMLRALRVGARAVPVYETVAVEPEDALLLLDYIEAVVVYSPKAARLVAGMVPPERASPLFACISEAAAHPLRAAGHEKVRWAPFPHEAALLKLLHE